MYAAGDRVEAQFGGKSRWYPGVVAGTNGDGTYHITYDDGDEEKAAKAEHMRRLGAAPPSRKKPTAPAASNNATRPTPPTREGSGLKPVRPGVTTQQERATTSTVAAGAARSSSSPSGAFAPGDVVEAKYRGKAWYVGKVAGCNQDGTFHIAYDDGDEEKAVVGEHVRAVNDKPRGEEREEGGQGQQQEEQPRDAPPQNPEAPTTANSNDRDPTTAKDTTTGAETETAKTEAETAGGSNSADQEQLETSATTPTSNMYDAPMESTKVEREATARATDGDGGSRRGGQAGEVEVDDRLGELRRSLGELREVMGMSMRDLLVEELLDMDEHAATQRISTLRASAQHSHHRGLHQGPEGRRGVHGGDLRHHRASAVEPQPMAQGTGDQDYAWAALRPELPSPGDIQHDLLLAAHDGDFAAFDVHVHLIVGRPPSADDSRAAEAHASMLERELTSAIDGRGRNFLHYAGGRANAAFIRHALTSLRRAVDAWRDTHLRFLQDKLRDFVDDMRADVSSSLKPSDGDAGRRLATKLGGFLHWAFGEADRIARVSELRCESAWERLVSAKDDFGRTPFVYAVGSDAHDDVVLSVVEAMWSTVCRARINSASPVNLASRAPNPSQVLDDETDTGKALRYAHAWEHWLNSPLDVFNFDPVVLGTIFLTKAVNRRKADVRCRGNPALFPAGKVFNVADGRAQPKLLQPGEVEGARSPMSSKGGGVHRPRRRRGEQHQLEGGGSVQALGNGGTDVVVTWFKRALFRAAKEASQHSRTSVYSLLMRTFDKHDAAGDGILSVEDLDTALRRLTTPTQSSHAAPHALRLSQDTLAKVARHYRSHTSHGRSSSSSRHDPVKVDFIHLVDDVMRVARSVQASQGRGDDGNEGKGGESEEEARLESKVEEHDDDDDDDREGVDVEARDAHEDLARRERGRHPKTGPVGLAGYVDVDEIRRNRVRVLDQQDIFGFTVLHASSFQGLAATTSFLVKVGAARAIRSKVADHTPMSLASKPSIQRTLFADVLQTLHSMDEKAKKRMNSGAHTHRQACQAPPMDQAKGAAVEARQARDWVTMIAGSNVDGDDVMSGMKDSYSRSLLHLVATAGAKDAGLQLVESIMGNRMFGSKDVADVDMVDKDGWTPLHMCCVHGGSDRRDIAVALLEAGANANKRTPQGLRTPLHVAAMAAIEVEAEAMASGVGSVVEDTEMVKVLLRNGSLLQERDGDGCTALMKAAQNGRVHTCTVLLLAGARTHVRDNTGSSALHYAAANGHADVARLLAQWDAELEVLVTLRNNRGQTPYALACQNTSKTAKAAVEALSTVWHAARRADAKRTQLCMSRARAASGVKGDGTAGSGALSGHVQSLRKLWLPAGLREKTRLTGMTCLHAVVVGTGDQQAQEALFMPFHSRRKAPRAIGVGTEGKERDREAASASIMGRKRYIQFLLKEGVFVDEKDRFGRTPLMLASCVAQRVSWELVPLLLRLGADPRMVDAKGNTPLHYAYAFCCIDTVTLLLAAGASPEELNAFHRNPKEVMGLRGKLFSDADDDSNAQASV